MGTISVDEIRINEIKGDESGTGLITIGSAEFPGSDSTPRSVASFGEAAPFAQNSVYQLVTSSTATINPNTTVVGIDFNGPVVLDLPPSTSANEIELVDEGGLCSAVNTITATSAGAVGSLVLSSPYSHLNIKKTSGSTLVADVRELPAPPLVPGTTVNDDGSEVVVDEGGNSVTTSADGNTVNTVLADGTTVDAVTSGNSTTSVTVSPDGTVEEAIVQNNGASETFTTMPDGTTVDAEGSTSGNSVVVTVSPTGEVTTEVAKNNGSSTESVVSPDGSTIETVVATNGKITVTEVTTTGVETVTKYVPWKTTYTVTVTPPGTTTTESPNPYYV